MSLAASLATPLQVGTLQLIEGLASYTLAFPGTGSLIGAGPISSLAEILTPLGHGDIAKRLTSGNTSDFAGAQEALHRLVEGGHDPAAALSVAFLLKAYTDHRGDRPLASPFPSPGAVGRYLNLIRTSPPLSREALLETDFPPFFDPIFPEAVLGVIFSGVVFQPIGGGAQSKVYRHGAYIVKIPFNWIWLNEADGQAVHKQPLIGSSLRLMNQLLGQSRVWRLVKTQAKLALSRLRPQNQADIGQFLSGYRLGLERAPDLMVPYRIARRDSFRLRRDHWDPEILETSPEVIFQKRISQTLEGRIKEALQQRDPVTARRLIAQGMEFQTELWGHGIADLDTGINIFENLEMTDEGRLLLIDAGGLSDERGRVERHLEKFRLLALTLLDTILSGDPAMIFPVSPNTMPPGAAGIVNLLNRLRLELAPADFRLVATEFLQQIAGTYAPTSLEQHWRSNLNPSLD